jgi:hypothetical protein
MEVWKDVKGYEGLYQISNTGKVKRILFKNRMTTKAREKLLTPCKNEKTGYVQVSLFKDGKGKLFLVHRLVAEAFIPNNNNLPQVNHKDENKENNNVNNLEWCTAKYNLEYGTARQRQANTIKQKVEQYDLQGNLLKIWDGVIDASKSLKINASNISSCCHNRRKSAGGYVWEYTDGASYRVTKMKQREKLF